MKNNKKKIIVCILIACILLLIPFKIKEKTQNQQEMSPQKIEEKKENKKEEEKPKEPELEIKKEDNKEEKKIPEKETTKKETTTKEKEPEKQNIPPKPMDENDTLRKTIEQKYSVKIKYASELNNYRPRGYTPNQLKDANKIKEALNTLNNGLSYYPTGFFQELKMEGMPVTFYLIESVPNNAFSGLTDREFMDNIIITLTTEGFLFRVMHHEIMHYIDAYLEIKMYPQNPYTEWITLNPKDFKYGVTNTKYVYNMVNNKYGTYFINTYAQTNEREDRASTFEDMISRTYAPEGCYDDTSIIKEKAKLLSKQIRNHIKSVSNLTTVHWERFIK